MQAGSGERPLIAFHALLARRTIWIPTDERDSLIAKLVKVLHGKLRTLGVIDSSVVEPPGSTGKCDNRQPTRQSRGSS